MPYRLKCLLCGRLDGGLVRLQEHAMHDHGYSQDDHRRSTRRYEGHRYIWTMPDGTDWLEASQGLLTAREMVLAQPHAVQEVLKAWMTQRSLGDPDPDWESYATMALVWWRETVEEFRRGITGVELSEEMLAGMMIAKLREKGAWDRIWGTVQ